MSTENFRRLHEDAKAHTLRRFTTEARFDPDTSEKDENYSICKIRYEHLQQYIEVFYRISILFFALLTKLAKFVDKFA